MSAKVFARFLIDGAADRGEGQWEVDEAELFTRWFCDDNSAGRAFKSRAYVISRSSRGRARGRHGSLWLFVLVVMAVLVFAVAELTVRQDTTELMGLIWACVQHSDVLRHS